MLNIICSKIISTILGNLSISVSEKGLCAVLFADSEKNKLSIPQAKGSTNLVLESAIEQLEAYFAGELKIFDLPLDLNGTDFQKKVWNALLEVPYGKTDSYKTLSKKIGDVKAIRAVGTANGKNPVSIIVPCHRIIGADGSLVGYAGELWRKEKLLHLEGALQPTSQLSMF
jgi:methylated-DNA-[protein]-cysteine S-methyltransferase